tara:strand:- start:297 stop:593 length:297 start_codon:yes stop_codon:yes gene_type:complete
LVEQSAFNRLVAGSSPAGGIMSENILNQNPWMLIDHTDGTKKVFCNDTNGVTPHCIDLTSSELTDVISQHIQMHQDEIAIWENLLTIQKEWIDAKKSS